ncbi:MAG TPA: hypothetical protein VNL13_09425 [Sulfolobales archaeon]|nr:hypothetical protein [Sulfolobales archaeon]
MDLVSVVSIIAALVFSSAGLSYLLWRKAAALEGRLESMGIRVGGLEASVGGIGKDVYDLRSGVEDLRSSLDGFESRVNVLESRLSNLETLAKTHDSRIDGLVSEAKDLRSSVNSIGKRVEDLEHGLSSYQGSLVELLASEGFIAIDGRDLTLGEVRKIIELSPDSFSIEDGWGRVRELLDKEELSLEEALELRDLARKAIEEHGDRIEAWKLHLYSSIAVGLARKKQAEKEKERREKRASRRRKRSQGS